MIHSFRFYQLKAGSRVLVAFEDVQGYLLSESGVCAFFRMMAQRLVSGLIG